MSKSWEQILGGYATNTLTAEEKRQLCEAALHDQALFDALADEEALKALLADRKARQQILASLQESEKSVWVVPSHWSWFSWVRQPSSLAWVGSIAAVGLALIFGWQMEKDWGPMVQQEQEAERSVPEGKDSDNNEVAFRSQVPNASEVKEQSQDPRKKDQRESERIAGVSSTVPSPQPSTIAKVAQDSERMRQLSAKVGSEDSPRQEIKKERRLKTKKSASQSPGSVIVPNIPEEAQRGVPALAPSNAEEKRLEQLAQAPSLADKQEGDDASPSLDFSELFSNDQKSTRVDPVEEELDGRRAQQVLGDANSQTKKALTGKVSDQKDTQGIAKIYLRRQTAGILYRFVRRVVDRKDEAIDITKFSGKWSDLELAIESNVAGHLYVLTNFGKGKWQWVRPRSANVKVLSKGGIKMKVFRSVNFALRQVTNTLGKPVVSSITLLLSSTPLTDLGKWLSPGVGLEPTEESLTEHRGIDNFVIDPSLEPGVPLRVKIALGD